MSVHCILSMLNFPFICLCTTTHINCICLILEIWYVCKLTGGLCYWNASYIRWSNLYYVLSPLFISGKPTHRSIIVHSVWRCIQRQRNRFASVATCSFA
jgi:hypothetical protein